MTVVIALVAVSSPTQGGLLRDVGDPLPSHEDVVVEGVAHVAGPAPYPVRSSDAGWTSRWPQVGQTVPVLVDRRRPARVRIRWDDLPVGRP